MFGMEMAQENIQASLGNVKKPDFPEQSFYSESLNAEHEVEQKEQGMAPSGGPCPITSQKHLNAVETATEKKLDEIKEQADKMGEEKFNAFEELENSLFSVGKHISNNSRIYTSAGTTAVGAGVGALLAHRKAKKAGLTGKDLRKKAIKGALIGGGAGLAAGEVSHVAHSVYGMNKKLKENGHTWKEVLKDPEAKKELKLAIGTIITSKKHGSDVKNW